MDPRPKDKEKEDEKKRKMREKLLQSEGNRPRFHTDATGVSRGLGESLTDSVDVQEAAAVAVGGEARNSIHEQDAVLLPRTKTFRLCDKFGSSHSKVCLIRTIRDGNAPDFILREYLSRCSLSLQDLVVVVCIDFLY